MDLSYLKGKGAVAPNQKQDNIPDGTYKVFVQEFMNYVTKGGKEAVQVTFKVLEGQYKDRLIWYYLIFPENPDEKQILKIQKFIYHFDPTCTDGEAFFNPGTYSKYLDKQFEVRLVTSEYNGQKNQSCFINKAIEITNATTEGYDPFA